MADKNATPESVPEPEQPPLIPQESTPPQEIQQDSLNMKEVAEALGAEITPFQWNIKDAPFSFYTVLYRPFQEYHDEDEPIPAWHWVGITMRGIDKDSLNSFENLMITLSEYGWMASNPDKAHANVPAGSPPSGMNGTSATPPPPTVPTGSPPPPPASNAAAGAPPPDAGVLDKGTGDLHSIFIKPTADGSLRVEFAVGNFKYTFSDARSPETIAGLFDPSLGWMPSHFNHPTYYDLTGHGLKVDWQKKTKGGKTYYDVLHVHR